MSSSQPTSPHGTHVPLPGIPPLRSAMKHASSSNSLSRPSAHVSRPTSPNSATSSPFITRLQLDPDSHSSISSPIPIPSDASHQFSPNIPRSASPNPDDISPSQAPDHLIPHSPYLSPSPAGYTPKVSFDTFENPAASMFSFTLSVKSAGYRRTRSTRVFLCAASADESGREALEWALEVLVQDGDELIVCRGVELEELDKDHDIVREEARDFMRQIQEKSIEYDPGRKLSLILEYVPGRITDTLDRLIALYRPDSVVVGTRGRSVWSGLAGMSSGIGSVSKYCLTHSPVPIIVVRPERKVKKAVEKRKADPKRGTHFDAKISQSAQASIKIVPSKPLKSLGGSGSRS